MGRRKIEMTIVKNKGSRQVTFSKRRMGLFKKAKEISILCAAQVAILVFSIGGKPYSFGYPNVEPLFERFVHMKKLNENPKDMKGKTILKEKVPTQCTHSTGRDETTMMINIMKKYSKKRGKNIVKMARRKYEKVREFPGVRVFKIQRSVDLLRDKLQSRINEFDASNSLLLLAEGHRQDRR